jgi:hypothetical protein
MKNRAPYFEAMEVRGLVHNNCNALLGMAAENPAILRAAADYLDKHNL